MICANYTSSQAPVAASLVDTSSDTQLSPQLKSNPTAKQSSSNGKQTEYYLPSLFSETFESSTGTSGEERLMSSAGASLVRTFQAPGGGLGLEEQEADFGGKWRELLAKYNPFTHSWKTVQCSLLEGLDEFSETWPKWGIMQGGVCWALTIAERPTNEKEFGYSLPTPTASDHKRTPIKMEYAMRPLTQGVPDDLAKWAVRESGLNHARLVPSLWEWAMGWPLAWTDLKPLGTDKFQSWLQQHGGF